jgi:hypothetical protein
MSPSRRRFLLQAGALLPLPFVARRLHRLAVLDLDPRLLRALGGAVLPSELGEGMDRVVTGFERWLAGYREGAELVHGFGTGELRRTGPSPALRWANQLRELEAAALKQQGTGFARLTLPAQQALVREAVRAGGQRIDRMPDTDQAQHVSVGLLAFFYGSPEAADFCYQARIGANSCRPLADSEARPLPLARKS